MRSERIMRKKLRPAVTTVALLMLAAAVTFPLHAQPAAQESDRFAQWEDAIDKFDQQDSETPPAKDGIVFIGSSSIRRWDLLKYFDDLDPPPVNRGFGGSQIVDATHFVDRLVLKHQPRTVVFYSGDNDIASGKSAADVASDFAEFCKATHAKLPEARIVWISIKPSPSRWRFGTEAQAANSRIRKVCDVDERLTFVDVWTPMLGDDGQPRPELFAKDMLHLNAAGYELWTNLVRPTLDK